MERGQPSTLNAFDCEILRNAFIYSAVEQGMCDEGQRSYVKLLAFELTGLTDIDPDAVDWITRQQRAELPRSRRARMKVSTMAMPRTYRPVDPPADPYEPQVFAEKHALSLKAAEIILFANGPSRIASDAAARAFKEAVAIRHKQWQRD